MIEVKPVASSTRRNQQFGGQSMTGALRRVMVRRPAAPANERDWVTFGYVHPVDHQQALDEHAAFVELLRGEGAEVLVAADDESGDLDAIFAYDPSLMTDQGAVLLGMGKAVRANEPAFHAKTYGELDIPIPGEIVAPGCVEGGDTLWLDERTIAVGRGYRTNNVGIEQLRELLEPLGVTVLAYDLPHWTGPGDCLHLMSFISPVAQALAVVHKPLMAVAFLEELANRGWQLIEIPDEEFASMGCNVLCLESYRVLVVNGNPGTRSRLEQAGCTVLEFSGDEISYNRAGGPTCLTRPILRTGGENA